MCSGQEKQVDSVPGESSDESHGSTQGMKGGLA